MQRWATVRCRVLRADGTAAPHAFVRLEPGKGVTAAGRTWQGETDAGGCITFSNVIPDRYRVLARPTRQSNDAACVETVASPGETSDVQVALGG
jgi:hypothetical protein